MIVLVVVSAMAVALASVSAANLQVSRNYQRTHQAFANAESGLEVSRYWLDRVRVPSSTPPSQYLSSVIADVQSDLQENAITNFPVSSSGSIGPVTLQSATAQVFTGTWSTTTNNPAILRVAATGASGIASRTVAVQFNIEPYRFPIFNYGIATKGAIRFPQNPTITGATQNWEADVYVESSGSLVALEVGGNANFDGDIDIGNPSANVSFGGDVQIAGDLGQTAIDEHVTIGADPVEFPVADTARFRPYATGPVIDSTTSLAGGMTLTNATIRAGTNPTFLGNVIIQGVLLIETPNIVRFTQNVAMAGVIVADGNTVGSGTNRISFERNFESGPYPLDPQFDAIRNEQGSSILAPSCDVSFTGNFASVNGVIAAGSLYFSANASATVKGTIISYSDSPTYVEGNISLDFDRAGAVEIPAGFDLLRVLVYDPTSYAMVF
ncbi:MAG: hypothetical protein KBE65_17840 [Phycisphaerae bacterium]|nr:hypothetical protein [Phycisphaerae bacterium]